MEKKLKKLTLNRETVKSLREDEIRTLAGGAQTDFCTQATRVCSPCCTITLCSTCCP